MGIFKHTDTTSQQLLANARKGPGPAYLKAQGVPKNASPGYMQARYGSQGTIRDRVTKAQQTSSTGRFSTSHTPKPKPKGKDLGSMSVLAFPMNVEFDNMQGHYIMFHIKNWVEGGSKLNASKLSVGPRQRAGENVSNYSLTLINRPMTRLAASIALYMPPQVNVSYGMKYADKEVGVVAHGAAAAMNAWKNTPGTLSALGAAAGQSVGVMGIAAKEMIIKAMDAMIPGLGAVEGITSGNIITPHMELMFEGVGRREFSFSFVMIPKSPPEAVMIEKIVKEFKLGMHPDYTEKSIMGFTGGQTSEDEKDMGVWNPVQGSILKTRAMTFPNTFK